MSNAVINQLFEEIENQYVNDGTIDPRKKEMLFEEMKKFVGGDKYALQINEAFQKLEEEDDDDNQPRNFLGSSSTGNNRSGAGPEVKARQQKLKFNMALKVFNVFQFSCTVEKTPMDEN